LPAAGLTCSMHLRIHVLQGNKQQLGWPGYNGTAVMTAGIVP